MDLTSGFIFVKFVNLKFNKQYFIKWVKKRAICSQGNFSL